MNFYAGAVSLASGRNIILIDGERLVELMAKFRVDVETKRTAVLLRIDENYFELD